MIWKLFALALLLALMALMLRNFGFKGASVFAVLAIVCLISTIASELSGISELLGYSELFSGEAMEYTRQIVKIVGVGYLFGIGADICTELGEVGISKAVVVAGRVEIFALALPYFKEILDIGVELLG